MADCTNCKSDNTCTLPRCCKNGQEKKCELTTITASQLSSALVFIIYVANNVNSLLPHNHTITDNFEIFVRVQVFATYFIALIYYFVGCWATEEDLIDELRTLNPILFYLQWVLRIVILATLGFYTNFTDADGIVKHYSGATSDITIHIYYLSLIFALFTLWDILVYVIGGVKDMKKYFVVDVCGLLLLILIDVFWVKQNLTWLAICLSVWCIFAAFLLYFIYELKFFSTLRRVLTINQIR
jgi:hypothetical protein